MKPKFGGPVKDGLTWPGKYKLNFIHPGVQYPWKFNCPEPLCFYAIVAADEVTLDKRIEQHTCPWYGGGTTTFSWGVMSDFYLGPIWKLLDDQVDIIKGTVPSEYFEQFTAAKFKARGIAEVLAVLMPPFFATADEIVREAIVRWEKRQAGEKYDTPGLGTRKFHRPPGAEGVDNPSWITKPEYTADQPRPKKPAPKYNLDPTQIAEIKARKGFPAEILSSVYGVPVDIVKSIQES